MEVLDGMGVGDLLLRSFNISSKKGMPFEDVSDIEACFGGQGPNGSSLILYDKTEELDIAKRPRLEVEGLVYDEVRDLRLFASKVIPTEHLLERNRGRIVNYCGEVADFLSLDFVNQFVAGYNYRSLGEAMIESFAEASRVSLGREHGVNEMVLGRFFSSVGIVEDDYEKFKKMGIRVLAGSGLETTAVERLKFIKAWFEKMRDKGLVDVAR